MSLSKSIEQLKFDTRMIDINMKDRKLNADELNSHLSSLSDSADNAVNLDFKHEVGNAAAADETTQIENH